MNSKLALGIIVAIILFFIFGLIYFAGGEVVYEAKEPDAKTNVILEKKVIHLSTPDPLKAVYMTQCVLATPSLRNRLVNLVEETELNAIVIDIKDYTGTVVFNTGEKSIDDLSALGKGCRAKDTQDFITELHDRQIYTIGRVTVFQDPLYTKVYPETAVKRESDGSVWKDRKGLSFIDVGAKTYWDHVVATAKAAYDIGFDEINFDYIRFPSDGNMNDTYFEHTGTTTKPEMLRQFFEYLDSKLSQTDIITSADVFGMVTTDAKDLSIGQVLEYALMYFDYVAPMVYPSHYPPYFNGWVDPNKVPYDIIKFNMDGAIARSDFLKLEIASSSPHSPLLKRLGRHQLRPWLQDFDYPVDYTSDMVRAQIQATYDSGLTSWMLWDPSNIYTKEALLLEL
ncbi:MAG: putative glycoside hydrolase [Patescibacteria group bacterium]